METGSHHSGPGDGCTLASIWVCNVLASNFQRPPDRGPEKDFQGSPRSDLSDGRGELHLGRPTYSRGTSHARFRYLGTNDFPLDETSAERPGASKTLACLSWKSPGSHRGDGPLYRSGHHLRCALLLLHHRPRSEAYREFQRPIRPPVGSSSSCARPSRINRLLGSSSLIGTPNMVWRSRSRYARWPSGRFARRSKVPGKTELLSAGSRVVGGTC